MAAVPTSVPSVGSPMDPARSVVRVLDQDPDLLGPLGDPLADAARQHLVARTLWHAPGDPLPVHGDVPRTFDGWLGLLVLDGFLVREVDLDHGLSCCELLGPGDVLRPWDEDIAADVLRAAARWRVLERTRVALLDSGFARRAARWPTISTELMRRTLARGHSLSVLLALTQARRADVRLRTLFTHLADRWGRVTPDGIVLPLPLTHAVIAQLTGLRRPSVSLTLAELERSGEIVRRARDQWLLSA